MAYEYKYKLTSKQNAPNSCLSTNFVPTLGQGSTDPTSPIHITRQVSFVGSFATCCAVFTCYCNIFSTGESFVCLLKCEVPYFQDLQPKEPCVRNKASSIQSLIPRLSLLMQPCNWSMGNFDQQNLNWSWASILELRQLVHPAICIYIYVDVYILEMDKSKSTWRFYCSDEFKTLCISMSECLESKKSNPHFVPPKRTAAGQQALHSQLGVQLLKYACP